MKRATLILAVLATVAAAPGPAWAGTIVGPSGFGDVGGSDTSWGIQFTALTNATLTGFDYTHRVMVSNTALTGTIYLNDITTNTNVYSAGYGKLSPSVIAFTGLAIALRAGDQYQLVATSTNVSGANAEMYQVLSSNSPLLSYADSDSEISVTQGVFNNSAGLDSTAWAAFTNIATTAAPIPEPASAVLLGLGGAGMALYARSRRGRLAA